MVDRIWKQLWRARPEEIHRDEVVLWESAWEHINEQRPRALVDTPMRLADLAMRRSEAAGTQRGKKWWVAVSYSFHALAAGSDSAIEEELSRALDLLEFEN